MKTAAEHTRRRENPFGCGYICPEVLLQMHMLQNTGQKRNNGEKHLSVFFLFKEDKSPINRISHLLVSNGHFSVGSNKRNPLHVLYSTRVFVY